MLLFKGNPTAVIIIESWLPVELMQNIAIENNLSEAAFVKRVNDQDFEIRWFSPIKDGFRSLGQVLSVVAYKLHNNDNCLEKRRNRCSPSPEYAQILHESGLG